MNFSECVDTASWYLTTVFSLVASHTELLTAKATHKKCC